MEERIYSITLTEEELKLFSEFLEQREYTGSTKAINRAIKKQMFMDRNALQKPIIKNGIKVHTPRTTTSPKTWTSEQKALNKSIKQAREAEKSVYAPEGFNYHAGESKRNLENLNKKITAGVKSSPRNLKDPSKNLTAYKGELKIKERGVVETAKDLVKHGKDYKNPEVIGKTVKSKRLN